MSGETEKQVSGWTTDTLHDQILTILAERSLHWQSLHDALQRASETNYAALTSLLRESDRRYDARFESLSQASVEADRRYAQLFSEKDLRDQQRFDAQQKALTDALLAAEKAVTAALTAANTAVTKAEIANEKRLDGVNEFRDTLRDQAATLMPRAETEALIRALTEKVTDSATSTRDQYDRLREQHQHDATIMHSDFQKAITDMRDDFQKSLGTLSTAQTLVTGRDHGIAALWGWIIGAAAIGGFVILLLHDIIK